MSYIDVDQLLPDRSGDYRILAVRGRVEYAKPQDHLEMFGRFNKRLLGSYWSDEKYGGLTVIGWGPINHHLIWEPDQCQQ